MNTLTRLFLFIACVGPSAIAFGQQEANQIVNSAEIGGVDDFSLVAGRGQ